MKKIDKFYMYLPLILCGFVVYLNLNYNVVTYTLPGIENIIDSIINYTSIIIGVLTALFGIVITLTDKAIMIKLQKSNDDKTIFKYGIETLISSFFLLIYSIVMQSLIRFEIPVNFIQQIISLWLGAIVFSLSSSIRTIYFLLMISFQNNDNSKRPQTTYTISDLEREELRKGSSKSRRTK